MTDQESETEEAQPASPPGGSNLARRGSAVMIAAIIASAVVALGCIIAFALVTYAFILNAPWT